MRVVGTARGARAALAELRGPARQVGFVPTMGALHAGHLSLIKAARAECEIVALSIFVNPLQFGPNEDLRTYPRSTKQDLAAAHDAGVDVVFLPEVDEMYPEEPQVRVAVGRLGDVLEGASRPGHFDGVATVVTKLLNVVAPDRVYFGQKDAQQVAVIKRLLQDLSFGTELVVRPTVREDDGLALSSRNAYLTPDQKERATVLYRALSAGCDALRQGGDAALAEKKMNEILEGEPQIDVDYARAVDPDHLGTPSPGASILLVVAARIGRTRLIDNMLVEGR